MGSASLSSPPIVVAFSIFLLSRLALHFAEEDSPGCPPFRCGNLNFSYSFDAAQRKCGLSTIQCEHDKPMMASEEGRLYEVKSINQDDNTIVIRDVYLSDNLVRNDCSGLYNFSTPIFPTLLLKEKDPDLFLFKCGKHLSPPAELLPANFGHFNRCKDYNLFYYGNSKQSLPHAHAQAPVPAPALPPVPDGCSVFHLPLHSPFDGNWSATLLSFLLDEGFYLQWSYPPGWHECEVKCPGDPNGALKCADTKPGGKKKLDMKLGIVVSGIAIGLSVTIIVLICCLRRKFSSHNFLVFLEKETKNDHIVEALFKNYGPLSPRKYSYSDIKKITNSFKEKIGQGGYGVVYKGKLVNSRLVAVKVLSEFKGNGEEFVNEIVSICRTSHVNIVTLVGFCFEGRKKALVYEFMPNGSLEKFIYDRKSSEAHHTLEWESLYKIAIGIARGLEYLHRGCNTRILHFDIKPHNILLDQDLCPKISDFGLAKLCPNKDSIISMLGARGTIGYTAPEVFCRNFGGISPKSDVYSYGMMVLEIVGGRKNTDVGADHTSEIFFPHWIYKRLKVDEDLGVFGLLTRVEEEIAKKMTLVGLWCIQTDPLIRPSMSKVVEMLEGSLDSLRIPPKPYLSSPSRSPVGSPTTWERSLTISLS